MYIRGIAMRFPDSALPSASATYESGRNSEDGGVEIQGCTRQKSPRVTVSSATMTSSNASMSSIVRVCGTTTSIVGTSGQFPRVEITPRDGV